MVRTHAARFTGADEMFAELEETSRVFQVWIAQVKRSEES